MTAVFAQNAIHVPEAQTTQLTRIYNPLLVHLDADHDADQLHRPARHASKPKILQIFGETTASAPARMHR